MADNGFAKMKAAAAAASGGNKPFGKGAPSGKPMKGGGKSMSKGCR